MATLIPRTAPKRGWIFQWSTNGEATRRSFPDKTAAIRFAAENGIPLTDQRVAAGHARRRTSARIAQIILSSHVVDLDSGCHIWTGTFSGDYPKLTWVCDEGYTIYGAHRLAYHLLVAPVPDDRNLTIDHLCRTPACVNPEHLELVSPRVNVLRGMAPMAINARKTHCIRGHEFTLENTIVANNRGLPRRGCRECRRIADRARRAAVAS